MVAGENALRDSANRAALGQPDEVADAVMFLFQNQFINGSVVEINGGVC